MGLKGNVHTDVEILDAGVHFVTNRIGCNVVDVHFVHGITNPVGDVDVINETAHLIGQG